MTDQTEDDWKRWGRLADRYREPRPRKILALDGGGIRGVITLGVLKRLEDELRQARGEDESFRLCDFFDLVGGTSTGAIIAAGLARGMSVDAITSFYHEFGTTAFERRKVWMLWQSLYGGGKLAKTLQRTFGARTDLSPKNLRCLLTCVTRNASTDSAWPISSNPAAKYNDPGRADCNLKIQLWKLVRASTAAPVFFPPEVISWDDDDPTKAFVFVDGGTTAYNNPAFLLFKMATEPAYQLGWPTGERNLLIVSVGTGAAPVIGGTAEDPNTNVLEAAMNTLSALMSQASVDQDISCRVVGRCTYGGIIDREIHDLIPVDPGIPAKPLSLEEDLGKAFIYTRYNAELTADGLKQLKLRGVNADKMRKMDETGNIDDLAKIGAAVGKTVDLAHLGHFVTA
ncbi:MAG TPA: patatin-like phospholipase family protein [Solirubrobacteraceae bacterium]|nr:patatin-like phospholipase family protein [Solirubrobacteraceae bacterium]